MRRIKPKQFAGASTNVVACVAAVLVLLWIVNGPSANISRTQAHPDKIELELQSRDRWGAVSESKAYVNANKMAIVVVDMWTSHSCQAATAEIRALVPPMNRTLAAARKLRIQVIFAPSGDDLKRWEGKPQRLGITSLPNYPMPKSNDFMKGDVENGPFATPCMCKVTRLKPGTDDPLFQCNRMKSNHNQNPNLIVRDQDLFIAAGHYRPGTKSALTSWGEPAQQELWNFVQGKHITTLIYMGVATNMCVINREFGMIEMRRLGLKTILVRDLTGAMTYNGYNPVTKELDPSWTPAVGTRYAIQYIEKNIGPSITSDELIRAARNPRE